MVLDFCGIVKYLSIYIYIYIYRVVVGVIKIVGWGGWVGLGMES